ncbi:hypothetical protein QAD02_019367 [Eretmocerus hayati]|uniref:Uncharacterized protein n=1 Tax=Eretmocerus hayati TaxID=131215 RepID=A0ACC2PIZ8_9HYME|nr:hypothetical protein QAD02_019367 [Eretmocerus hayati]
MQGMVNSPTWLNIFKADILNLFEINLNNGTYCIAFRDDVLVYVAEETLQLAQDKLESVTTSSGFKNPSQGNVKQSWFEDEGMNSKPQGEWKNFLVDIIDQMNRQSKSLIKTELDTWVNKSTTF